MLSFLIEFLGEPVRLSKEHKSSDPEEQKRIIDNKGFIDPNGRVNCMFPDFSQVDV